MQLCFDATRFGTGLDGAIGLAASKGIKAIEYSFAPFSVRKGRSASNPSPAQKARASKSGTRVTKSKSKAAGNNNEFSDNELSSLQHIKHLSKEHDVSVVCLNLDYCLKFEEKNGHKNKEEDKDFSNMLSHMSAVAKTIGCPKLSISIEPGARASWLESAEKQINAYQKELSEDGIALLLRLSTPKENIGKSLKQWITMEPQDWRDLIAACPGLSLSFSPADCVWLGIDYLKILSGIVSGIDHIEAHDIEISRTMLNDSGMYGPLWWRYRVPGKGAVDWTQLIEALKLYGYEGSLSIHLDDEFVADDQESLEDALDGAIKLLKPLVKNF